MYDKSIPAGVQFRIKKSLPEGDGGASCGMPGDIVETINYDHDMNNGGDKPYVYVNIIQLSERKCDDFVRRYRENLCKNKAAIYFFLDLLEEIFNDYIEDQPQLEDDDL